MKARISYYFKLHGKHLTVFAHKKDSTVNRGKMSSEEVNNKTNKELHYWRQHKTTSSEEQQKNVFDKFQIFHLLFSSPSFSILQGNSSLSNRQISRVAVLTTWNLCNIKSIGISPSFFSRYSEALTIISLFATRQYDKEWRRPKKMLRMWTVSMTLISA